jgi:hypothetical protein
VIAKMAAAPDGHLVVFGLLGLRVVDLEVADLQDLPGDVVDSVVASKPGANVMIFQILSPKKLLKIGNFE